MPAFENVTVFHMRDLAAGIKKIIKGQDVLFISVPQFKGLSIEEFLKFSKGRQEVWDALPDPKKEIDKMPRQYIANVIHTLIG